MKRKAVVSYLKAFMLGSIPNSHTYKNNMRGGAKADTNKEYKVIALELDVLSLDKVR